MTAALFLTLALISFSATALTAALVGSSLHGLASVALYHLEAVNTALARIQIWTMVGQAITLPGWLTAAVVVAILARGPARLHRPATTWDGRDSSPVVQLRRDSRARRKAPPAV
jgi:hypothetical protein